MSELFGIMPFTFDRMLHVFEEYPEISEVVLFGSRALGRERKGSDIDLALDGPEVTPLVAMDLAARLNEREPLPYHFDVLARNSLVNEELLDHLQRVGRVIFRRQDHRLKPQEE